MKFLCPNGHQLSTSFDRAGKPGQCPKCGVKFLVPEADDVDDDAADSDAEAANGSRGGKSTPAAKAETIEFLCPNGHRLSGPARLQGKPGQCPHCKTKFRIPVYEEAADDVEDVIDVEEIEEIDEVDAVDEVDEIEAPLAAPHSGGSGAGSELGFLANLDSSGSSVSRSSVARRGSRIEKIGPIGEPGSSVHGQEVVAGSDLSAASGVPAPMPIATPHPLSEVFLRFWKQRGKDGVVELHLNDGKVVTPKRFSRRLSQPQFGVFALDDSDGTHALVTIPWSAIAQLHLRGIKKLPEGIFD